MRLTVTFTAQNLKQAGVVRLQNVSISATFPLTSTEAQSFDNILEHLHF